MGKSPRQALNEMCKIHDSRMQMIPAHDGASIRVAGFAPHPRPAKLAGVIQIVHGFGESMGHYGDVVDFFVGNGYACVIHDQRGFGEMPDKTPKERRAARGVIPSYDHLLEDVKTVRGQIGLWYPGVPVILFGHSMGGGVAANYLLRYPSEDYEKAILEAPWFRLYKPLSPVLDILAKILGKISPKIVTRAKLDADDLSREQTAAHGQTGDDVFHNRMSIRLYAGAVAAGAYALEHADRIPIPTLVLGAGADKILSTAAIRGFAERAGEHVTYMEYPDAYHCIHRDTAGAQALADVLEFLKE